MEVTFHLTGLYPDWWEGRRFKKPVNAWAATESTESTRDILQTKYLGSVKEEEFGTGTIPRDCLLPGTNTKYNITRRQGIPDAVDTIAVRHVSGGISYLSFKSYEQGRGKFQGTQLDVVHFDEEPPHDVYDEVLIRLFGIGETSRGGVLLLTMTPLSGMTEIVERFWNNADENEISKDRVFIQATWDDADHISKEEKLAYREKVPAHMLEAREKGIPSIGEGMVYPVPESQIVVPRREIPDYWKQGYAMDFGWNPDPTAALFFAYDPELDILYFTKEYKQKEATPKAHAEALYRLGADWMNGVADPYGGKQANQADGETMIQKYNKVGLRLFPANRQYKMNGVIEVLEMMREGRIKVFDDLQMWLSEFRMYAYDNKGKPRDKNDHLMDCMRYIVQSGMSHARSKRSKVKRFWDNVRPKSINWEAI